MFNKKGDRWGRGGRRGVQGKGFGEARDEEEEEENTKKERSRTARQPLFTALI